MYLFSFFGCCRKYVDFDALPLRAKEAVTVTFVPNMDKAPPVEEEELTTQEEGDESQE